jgi:hypothetical protein
LPRRSGSYEFIDFVAPRGWKVERAAEWVVFKKDDGTHYSNVFIIKPRPSLGTHRADVDKDWALHAAKQGLAAPAQSDGSSRDGWEVTVGAGATKGRNAFEISVTTFTGRGLSWALVGYYNDTTLLADMESLSQSLKLHEGRLASWREKNLGASAVAACGWTFAATAGHSASRRSRRPSPVVAERPDDDDEVHHQLRRWMAGDGTG